MGLGNFLGFGRKSEKVDVESSSSPTGKTSIKDPLSSSKTKTEANDTPIQQPNSNTEEDPLTPDTTSLNPTSLPSDHLHTHINLSLPHPHLHPHPPSSSPSSSPTNQEVPPPPPRENPQQWTPRQAQKELHLQKQNTKTIGDILTSISVEDFKHVHEAPCVREALLAGIGVGAGGGGLKFVFGASIPKAANWAAGLFCATSLIVHETCQYRKYRERANMQKAIEIMERRRAERKRSGDGGGGAGDGGAGKENVGSASPSGSNNGDTSTEQNGENKKSWYKFW